MINKVQNQLYTNQQASYNRKLTGNTDKFATSYNPRQFVMEHNEKEEKKDAVLERLLDKEDEKQAGVELELSNYKEADGGTEEVQQVAVEQKEEKTFLQRLSILWKEIKQAFLHFLGEDVEKIKPEQIIVEDGEEAKTETIEIPETAKMETLETSEATKTEALKTPEFYESLYENGTKKLAKNSTLLTAYNKQGVIVQRDANEEKRILHVHPHTIDELF